MAMDRGMRGLLAVGGIALVAAAADWRDANQTVDNRVCTELQAGKAAVRSVFDADGDESTLGVFHASPPWQNETSVAALAEVCRVELQQFANECVVARGVVRTAEEDSAVPKELKSDAKRLLATDDCKEMLAGYDRKL